MLESDVFLGLSFFLSGNVAAVLEFGDVCGFSFVSSPERNVTVVLEFGDFWGFVCVKSGNVTAVLEFGVFGRISVV